MNLGVVLKDQGKLAAAESLFTESLAIQEKTLGADHPNIGGSLYNRAKLLQAEGKLAEAETDARRAMAILGKVLPSDDPTMAAVESGLGSILTDRGRPTEAEPLLRHALGVYAALIPGQWQVEQLRSLLGDAVLGRRRFAEAETLLVSSYEALKDDPAVSADRKAQALGRVIRLYASWDAADPGAGKGSEAAAWRARASASAAP
jgi:tetratricopeptide (TPR) repeat protein